MNSELCDELLELLTQPTAVRLLDPRLETHVKACSACQVLLTRTRPVADLFRDVNQCPLQTRGREILDVEKLQSLEHKAAGRDALRTSREARTCVRFVAALSIAMLLCYLGPTYLIGQCSSPSLVRLTSQKSHDEMHLSGDRMVSWRRQLCTRETLLNDSQVSGGHASGAHLSGTNGSQSHAFTQDAIVSKGGSAQACWNCHTSLALASLSMK